MINGEFFLCRYMFASACCGISKPDCRRLCRSLRTRHRPTPKDYVIKNRLTRMYSGILQARDEFYGGPQNQRTLKFSEPLRNKAKILIGLAVLCPWTCCKVILFRSYPEFSSIQGKYIEMDIENSSTSLAVPRGLEERNQRDWKRARVGYLPENTEV
ncbi:hypothetical protein F5Y16DRAFT_3378 [Xylariaceae sp. FL0255]|nr:hypothetical protein F5Y16DRAFT_3378 [Xylariaceae sp. FL0255]